MNSIFYKLSLIFLTLIVLLSLSAISATDSDLQLDEISSAGDFETDINSEIPCDNDLSLNCEEISPINRTDSLSSNSILKDSISSQDALIDRINNADDGDTIIIQPGNYTVYGIRLDKNLTICGNGSPDEIILDGDHMDAIFTISSQTATVCFNNLTFINAAGDFGGAISIDPGYVYVDNCVFMNNSASTNGAAICNGGIDDNKNPFISHLFVNNSVFIGNDVGHDGGAISSYYGDSEIYNSYFSENYAARDGGAIRVSLFSNAYVENCTFFNNSAGEWGGAYYSWVGDTTITNCSFLNNTAGTYGGAVMISGNINITNSLISDNNAQSGGAFYITNPMYDDQANFKIRMYVNNNTIVNNKASDNVSDYLYNTWKLSPRHLYVNMEDNYWGSNNPFENMSFDPYGFLKNPSSWINSPAGEKEDSKNNESQKTNSKEDSNALIQSDKDLDGGNGTSLIRNDNVEGSNNTLAKNLNSASNSGNSNINSTGVSVGSRDTYRMTEIIKNNDAAALKSLDISYLIALIVIVLAFVIGLSKHRKRE